MSTATGVCEHCGQPLPGYNPHPTYGERKPNKIGIAVAIAVHLLVVLVYLLNPQKFKPAGKQAETFISLANTAPVRKPVQRDEAPRKKPKAIAKAQKPVVVMPRLPNTITVPFEPPKEEVVKQEEPQKTEIPPEMDMQAYIEAQKRKRGVAQDAPSESANEKAMRNIKANIARANAAAQGDDGTGGIFSISNQTFHSAELKFRGWNPNFKRRWLQQVNVEVTTEPDIETAIIKKMIEIIRKEKTGDFEWESHRLGRTVTLSARPQDQAQLEAFLFKEMFPKYIAPAKK